MIIGAGKMGEACLRHLAKRGVKSVLVFRTGRSTARSAGGRVRPGGPSAWTIASRRWSRPTSWSVRRARPNDPDRAQIETVMRERRKPAGWP